MNLKTPEALENIFIPLSGLRGLPPRRALPPPSPELAPPGNQPQFTPFFIPPLQPQGTPFACPQCQTSLTLFGAGSPGLCPVCQFWITDIPRGLQQLIPLPFVETLQGLPEFAQFSPNTPHFPTPAPGLAAASRPTPVPFTTPASIVKPEAAEPSAPDESLTSRRPSANWISRTGNFNFRPLGLQDIASREPEYESEAAGPTPGKGTQPAAQPYHLPTHAANKAKIAKMLTLASILVFATILGLGWVFFPTRPAPMAPSSQALDQLRGALNAGAQETLKAVLGTRDLAAIAEQVIGGQDLLPEIQRRLDSPAPLPRFSEADTVSTIPVFESDLRRGITGLIYQAPPDDTMSLESPLLAAEMARGTKGLGFLESAALTEFFSKPPPREALAFFAKKNGKLLLDWDLFIQTWDRTLRSFIDGDLGPGPIRFRVILSLDKPVFENGEMVGETIIRVQDPLHREDVIRVPIYYHDPVVTALLPAARVLETDPSAGMRDQTATLELSRSPDTGRVTISRFVCKEFLGLGGRENDPTLVQAQTSRR